MSNELTTYQEVTDLVAIRMDGQKFPRLKNISPVDAVAGIAKVITGAMNYTGRQYEKDGITLIASGLYTELLQDYEGIGTANITLQEIQYCIRRAVLGLGPEMYGINVASLYKVICDYCTHEGRQAQESANNRTAQARKKALANSPAGIMLQSYIGQTLNTLKK